MCSTDKLEQQYLFENLYLLSGINYIGTTMSVEIKKQHYLYLILGAFFVTNALVAEFIGVKVFSLEQTFGYKPVNWVIFGETYSFQLTIGVLLWPFVFIMTDLINEYYGTKGVRRLSYLAVVMISYAFLAVFAAIETTPPDWWINQAAEESIDMQVAYKKIFGQGMNIILGSLIAFLIGQLLDVSIFHQIKKRTGEKYLWLRANGSTFFSQLIDSFLVLYIAFYLGGNWPMKTVIAVGCMNMLYKITIAIVLTPLLYFVHELIERYLGKENAARMKAEAQADKKSS